MSVVLLVGPPGHGKTLFAVYDLAVSAMAGRLCATDINILPACPAFDRIIKIGTPEWPIVAQVSEPDPDDPSGRRKRDWSLGFWDYLPPGTKILIDEAHYDFDSSMFAKYDRDTHNYFHQHRHYDHDLVFITHKPENLWVRLRRLAERVIVCEWNWRSESLMARLGMPITWSRFRRYEFADDTFRREVGYGSFTYREAMTIFPWYQTREIKGDLRSKEKLALWRANLKTQVSHE